jgi:hypothetical protein
MNTRRNSSAHGTRLARAEPLGVAAAGGGSPGRAGTSARSFARVDKLARRARRW